MDMKAVALRAMRHEGEALLVYDALLAANPFYEPAWRNKGHLLSAMGDPDEARVCFEMADMINPHSGAQAPPKRTKGPVKRAAAKRPPRDEASEPDILEDDEKDDQ
jgi:tetratricopeptide (TPR) repeat protein